MKKTLLSIFILVVCLSFTFLISSCKSKETQNQEETPTEDVSDNTPTDGKDEETLTDVITETTPSQDETDEPSEEVKLEVSFSEDAGLVNIDRNNQYTFIYTVNKECQTTITCDLSDGYTLNNNKATFTTIGVYTFTITAVLDDETASDSIVINVVEDLKLEVSETKKTINIDEESTYTFVYEANKESEYKITCDVMEGYTLANNRVTFSKTGIYTFTITATSGKEIVSSKVVIDVIENLKLDVSELEKTINIDIEDSYVFNYKTNKECNVNIICDKTEGYSLSKNRVTFTKVGIYTFTIEAKVDDEVVKANVVITVEENLKVSFLEETTAINLDEKNSYYFIYNINKECVTTITCDLSDGYTLENDKVTFTKVGVYTFTITAVLGDEIAIDSIVIYVTENLKLEVSELEKVINIDNEATYTFVYESNKESEYEITCDLSDGYTLENNTVTFNKTGVYTFTITAKSGSEIVGVNVVIRVIENLKLLVSELEKTINIDDEDTYVFIYETNKESENEITCNLSEGYTVEENVVTFSKTGVYTFTITATFGSETISANVVVTVEEYIKPLFGYYIGEDYFNRNKGYYYPTFTLTPIDALVEIVSDKEIEITNDGIKFIETGVHTLTITATIGRFSDVITTVVDVYDTVYLEGEGTQENPWLVSSAKELETIRDAILNDEEDLVGKHFLQTNDIDLASVENWIPIGTIGLPFEGIYDGGNYEINNLNIYTDESFQGLFGFVTGTVKNVTVSGNIVVTTANLPYSHSLVGGIAGGINNGALIRNCINKVNITADSSAGGIVGEILETDFWLCGEVYSRVVDCINYGTITANFSNAKFENTMYFGGIAGKNHGIIENCINNGFVDALSQADETEKSNDYVGGITGYSYQPFYSGFGPNNYMNYAAIKGCINNGNVSGIHAVGGIVGQHVLGIDDCENNGDVIGGKSVGGIAGITGTSGTSSLKYTKVINCINNGDVITSEKHAGGISGYTYDDIILCTNTGLITSAEGINAENLGGIVGTGVSGKVEKCINYGNVSSNKAIGGIAGQHTSELIECENEGLISGANCVGGIVGIAGNSSSQNAVITSCHNRGIVEVSIKDAGGIAGYSYADISLSSNSGDVKPIGESLIYYIGGIVGTKADGKLLNCENSGDITASAATNSVVGGIVGDNVTGTIELCINKGSVTGTNIVGGIAGRCKGNGYEVINCKSQDGIITGISKVGGIVGSAEGTSKTSNITIKNSENYSEIVGETGYIGGIVGMHGSYNLVTYCTNYGKVSGLGYTADERVGVGGISGHMFNNSKTTYCVNNGQVVGERVTGGICGSSKPNASTPFEISNCTNNGNIICNYLASKDAWVGGILGYGTNGSLLDNTNNGKITNTNGSKYVNAIYGKISSVTTSNNQDLYVEEVA